MAKTVSLDFRSFCHGDIVEKDSLNKNGVLFSSGTGVLVAYSQTNPQAITVTAGNVQQAFDPIIAMLQNMSYPVAFICIAWACLEAMIGKPASAVSRAKWAILGYLAMRYVPALLKSI